MGKLGTCENVNILSLDLLWKPRDLIAATWSFSSNLPTSLLVWDELWSAPMCVSVCLFYYRVPRNADYFFRQVDKWRLWYTAEETQRSRRHAAFITFPKKSLPPNLCVPQQVGYASSCWFYLTRTQAEMFHLLLLTSVIMQKNSWFSRVLWQENIKWPSLLSCMSMVLVVF